MSHKREESSGMNRAIPHLQQRKGKVVVLLEMDEAVYRERTNWKRKRRQHFNEV